VVQDGHLAEGVAEAALGDKLVLVVDPDLAAENHEQIAAHHAFVEYRLPFAKLQDLAAVQNELHILRAEPVEDGHLFGVLLVLFQVGHASRLPWRCFPPGHHAS
jgi:hypothetical protein